MADRAFDDPTFGDQLFGDSGHGAALHARTPSQTSTGNRLLLANQVQHNATVDIAGSLTPGNPEVVQINFSHRTLFSDLFDV
jgi:hypothetical protein